MHSTVGNYFYHSYCFCFYTHNHNIVFKKAYSIIEKKSYYIRGSLNNPYCGIILVVLQYAIFGLLQCLCFLVSVIWIYLCAMQNMCGIFISRKMNQGRVASSNCRPYLDLQSSWNRVTLKCSTCREFKLAAYVWYSPEVLGCQHPSFSYYIVT